MLNIIIDTNSKVIDFIKEKNQKCIYYDKMICILIYIVLKFNQIVFLQVIR